MKITSQFLEIVNSLYLSLLNDNKGQLLIKAKVNNLSKQINTKAKHKP